MCVEASVVKVRTVWSRGGSPTVQYTELAGTEVMITIIPKIREELGNLDEDVQRKCNPLIALGAEED